ncbi:MAG: 4-carboxymuconolactone decarboxylase [Acidobacteriaceae bacterium]|jgi:4-carboxymuconolactone decarboxylase|nr:4-carboxymuconolactone decarboxylase [Acidobacteriaceae bacterium]MEA2263210.1 4-carboxymuconolactone decarboxylase [Acidobacteriaceae bacterium]MEA2543948.1 4-carboxymuconolactone decarboxylase [Acidobacteriaceae bacterium]
MSKKQQNLGGRLPLPQTNALTGTQRTLYDTLMSTWVPYARKIGVEATTADDRLIGPFNTFLLHPEIAEKLSDLQAAEAKNTTLPKRVREVVVLMVGAVWGAAYELYAQAPVAREMGFSDADISTLAKGELPDELSGAEKLAARLAKQLATEHRVDDATYEEAVHAFGTTGLFDIVAVMGVYHTVCGALALFEVPVPAEASGQG